MWAVIHALKDVGMRSTSLSRPVLVAALGCMILSACGTHDATTARTSAGSAVPAAATASPSPGDGDGDAEMRFLALNDRVLRACAPEAPDSPDGGVPRPEDLPGWEGVHTPRYGPGETPPGVPAADGSIPVPLDDPARPASAPGASGPEPAEEVPLTGIETCYGNEHAQRVRAAFRDARPSTREAMRKRLTGLDYPAARILPMPDHAGAPRVRLDLRQLGGHVVLEVTGAGTGVDAEAFGAPGTEDVDVTEVKRQPETRPEAR